MSYYEERKGKLEQYYKGFGDEWLDKRIRALQDEDAILSNKGHDLSNEAQVELDILLELKDTSTLAAVMPKSPITKRIEVHLMPEVVNGLKKIADEEKRSLKNLCEIVLERYLQEVNKKKK